MSSGLDGLVDVHTHIVPESFPDYIGRHHGAPWPSMATAQACHRHVMVSGSVYRTVSHQCWDCAQRRADMNGIAGNVNGTVIGDPRFLPFFQAAVELDAAVFVHPLRPAAMDRLVGPAALEQVLAFPGETGLAAASMITGGTFAGAPGLRIAFSHGGGTLSTLLPRLQHAWHVLPQVRQAIPLNPLQAARQMYFDDLVYDAATIHGIIGVFGITQVMAGSDYPFTIMDPHPAARLAGLGLGTEALDLLRSANAMRWLGRDAS